MLTDQDDPECCCVRSVIRVHRDVLTRSAATGLWHSASETALFVTDVVLPAVDCAKAIRNHWSIENRSHYVRDGSFAENTSRIRCVRGLLLWVHRGCRVQRGSHSGVASADVG